MNALLKKLKIRVKNFDHLDLCLVIGAAFFLTLLLTTVIPVLATWARAQNKWILLGIAVALAIRPAYRTHLKEIFKH